MLPKNFDEPMGAPTIFEKQIPASTEEVTDSGNRQTQKLSVG
ncbi:MAG: hypothetical protein P8X74_08860 [Reinekea sp.]